MGKLLNALRSENVAACLCFAVFALIGYVGENFDSLGVAALSGLAPLVSPLVFFVVRATNRKWRHEYEIERYLQRRRRYPLQKLFMLVPSAVALFVLFSLPVASHLLAPLFGGRFAHYRIPVPWKVMVLKPPFVGEIADGLICFVPDQRSEMLPGIFRPLNTAFSSSMSFSAKYRPNPEPAVVPQHAEGRNFEIGRGQVLRCSEFQSGGPWYQVSCVASQDAENWGFSAHFGGDPKDLPRFYKILEGTTHR